MHLTPVIMDEELGAAPFVIIRRTWRKETGHPVLMSEDRIETRGTIHPASMKDLSLLPEEYHFQSVLHIHSPVRLSLGETLDDLTFMTPDLIEYGDRHYMVFSIRDWLPFGFCRAYAVLQKEEDD